MEPLNLSNEILLEDILDLKLQYEIEHSVNP